MASRRISRRGSLRALIAASAATVLAMTGAVSAAAAEIEATTTISGTVTRESDGTPVEGVGVFMTNVTTGGFSFNGSSDANGDYIVSDLPAGEYVVRFAPDFAAPDLVSEFWDSAPDFISAQRITAVGGETISDIDAALGAAGSITGTVTRESDGTPVDGAIITVSFEDGQGAVAMAAADGTFRVVGVPDGDHVVQFEGPAGSPLTSEYWNDATDRSSATPLSVVTGVETSGIDVELASASAITGVVLADGAPIAGLVVEAHADGAQVGTTFTEADGSYALVLPAGAYTVSATGSATDTTFATQYFPTATTPRFATPVVLGADADRTGVDFNLVQGGDIRGMIRGVDANLPGSGAEVTAYILDGSGWYPLATVSTTGAYDFSGLDPSAPQTGGPLPAGTYTIGVEADGFCPRFFGGATTLDGAQTFELAGGETRAGIDVPLPVECATPGPVPTLTLSAGTVRAGDEIGISGTGFRPGLLMEFQLYSEPMHLGNLTADANGAFSGTLRIPADAEVGSHYILARSGTSKLATANLQVTAAAAVGGGATGPSGGALANTGAEAPTFAAMMALGLLAAGLVLVRRRRVEL